MELIELSPKDFNYIFTEPYFVYGRTNFNILNKEKVDELFFLAFKEKKYKLGIICGRKENILKSPFSAPFGGFTFIKDEMRINYLDSALVELEKFAIQKGIREIEITLPPVLYDNSFISKQINSFFRKNYAINEINLNYHFDLKNFTDNYISSIWHNARKNLKIAFKEELKFHYCIGADEKKLSYEIIKVNRNARGFPLKMTWEQIQETIEIIKADFFIVFYKEEPVASAIIFQVSKNIYQVIYWGDNPEYSKHKPMNFLSYKVFEYYKNRKAEILDIGPSTENSVPNLGLCEFKESIGCEVTMKLSIKKIIYRNEN